MLTMFGRGGTNFRRHAILVRPDQFLLQTKLFVTDNLRLEVQRLGVENARL